MAILIAVPPVVALARPAAELSELVALGWGISPD